MFRVVGAGIGLTQQAEVSIRRGGAGKVRIGKARCCDAVGGASRSTSDSTKE